MDFKGVHKSAPRNRLFADESASPLEAVPKDQLPASEPGSMLASTLPPVRRKPARWLVALAAILIVCVVGGGFLAAHIWWPGQTQLADSGPAPAPLCLAPSPMMPPGALRSISGLAENDVWAIEDDPNNQSSLDEGGIILHWDGIKWNTFLQANGMQDFNDIVEVNPNNVWMVGDVYPTVEVEAKAFGKSASTLIEHWDGAHWQTLASPNGPALYSISATSADDIWALGGTSTAGYVMLHWNGQRWNSVPIPLEEQSNKNTFGITEMKAFTANDVWVTAEAVATDLTTARTMILHWNGTRWQTPAHDTISGSSYTGLPFTFDGTSDDDLWFVEGAQIKHWNGKKWSVYKQPPLPKNSMHILSGITALGSNDVWVTGQWDTDQGIQPLIEHWNGQQWQIILSPIVNSGLGGGVYMIGKQLWVTSSFTNDDRSSPYSTQIAMLCSERNSA